MHSDTLQEEYAAYCARHGTPDSLVLMLGDMNSVLRGKWLPASQIDKLYQGAVRLPLSTYMPNIFGEEVAESGLGIVVGDPDGIALPIAGSLHPIPWSPQQAQWRIALHCDGQPSELEPRQVLQRQLDRLAALGLRPVVATELEFYLLQPRPHADAPPQPPAQTPPTQNYDLEVCQQRADVLNAILHACRQQGIASDTLIAEYGPGQFEINFHHSEDVQEAAETALRFRHLVRAVARQHALEATFMAKPYSDHPGNGMHVHISLLNSAGDNVFASDAGSETISPMLRQAIAGCLDSMADMQAIFAPHLNSYRRFQPASFAPTTPCWGLDNRAAAVRVPATTGAGARLEHRLCGADVNPHLTLAAILGGIAHGLEQGLTPPAPLPPGQTDAPGASPLTHDWSTAVTQLAHSSLAGELLGRRYREAYVAVRRDEIARLSQTIPPHEYQCYLGRL